jgi:hypothetical protein
VKTTINTARFVQRYTEARIASMSPKNSISLDPYPIREVEAEKLEARLRTGHARVAQK